MDYANILSKVDHTLLDVVATWESIRQLADDAVKFNTASICIPPSYVKQAKEYLANKMTICTVIGFPNGYCTTETKTFEARDAIANGADEIDMVINLGWVKNGLYTQVLEEIAAVKEVCGHRVLKVIIETSLLNDDEKIKMCKIVGEAGADFIKTSTGFAGGGATFADIDLMKKHVDPRLKIKASGGISSLADAEKFIALGAQRLGTSRIVKLVKESKE